MESISLYLLVLVAVFGCIVSDIDATKCGEYKKVGCFTRNDKIFKHMLITDLDPTHHKWGQEIDWGDYHGSLRSLACRCRTKAVGAGYKWFSLGFYGECWGASEKKFEVDHMNTGMCVNGDAIACNHELDKECSGVEDNEYVYEVTTAMPGKDLIGYWDVTWSSGTLPAKAKYSIELVDNVVIMREASQTSQTSPVKASTSAKYPAKDGWLQVVGLHAGKVHIYIKAEGGKIVDMKLYKPATGKTETSKVKEGIAPVQSSELSSTCSFVIGDGNGGSEVKIGTQKGEVCIQACIERKKKDSRINGVTVYKSDRGGCWCELGMTGVSKSTYSTRLYKTCFLGPAYVDLAPQQVALVKNNLAYTLPVLKKQYDISFEVYPTKWLPNQWGSILHLTTSGNIDEYGARIPGVWFSPWPKSNQNSICPATALSGNLNYYSPIFYSIKVNLNTWSRMRITQELVGGKYIYRVYLNGKQIHERENTKAEEFYNVKVFLGDPWYPAQPGYIRNVNIRNIREKTLHSTELFQHKESITKNSQPYTVPLLAKQFDISFQVYPTSFPKTRWGTNVLHMTTSGNYGHGMRIPSVWFRPNPVGNTNTLYVVFEVNGNVNYFPNTPSVKTNEWTSIRITQQLEGSKYMYRIFLDGKQIHEVENKKPYDFHNVKVFAADPWHDTQPGYIRNLRIHNLGVSSDPAMKLLRARSSSVYGGLKRFAAIYATDGDPYTFAVTDSNSNIKNAWWEAELEQPAIVDTVQLILGKYAFSQGYYKGLKLQVARYPADPWSDCTTNLKITGPKGGERAFLQEIKCTRKTAVKYIRLTVPGSALYIPDVKVHGIEIQEPVLPLMNAKSSSTYYNMKQWVPSHAIDGNFETFSVTNQEITAWWEAELKNAAVIANFELYLGSYAFRMGYYEGLRVQVRMKPTDHWSNCISGIKINGPIGSERSFPQEVYCNRPVPSKYLRILITLNKPLYLSEVIVHGKA